MSDGTGESFLPLRNNFPAFYVFRKSLIRFLCLDSPARRRKKAKEIRSLSHERQSGEQKKNFEMTDKSRKFFALPFNLNGRRKITKKCWSCVNIFSTIFHSFHFICFEPNYSPFLLLFYMFSHNISQYFLLVCLNQLAFSRTARRKTFQLPSASCKYLFMMKKC